MPAFVDDHMDVVDDEESGAVGEGVKEEKGVETEQGDLPVGRETGFPLT